MDHPAKKMRMCMHRTRAVANKALTSAESKRRGEVYVATSLKLAPYRFEYE